MSKMPRQRLPFYLRKAPCARYDIQRLRPKSLPVRTHFETKEDAVKNRAQSITVLEEHLARDRTYLLRRLERCGDIGKRCEQAYCPVCARTFRIWFIGQLLRIVQKVELKDVRIMTVLLKAAPRRSIGDLELRAFDATL